MAGENKPIYTHCSEELNAIVAELMEDYEKLVEKAKSHGLDIRLYDSSETLVLYYNDDYPDTLLVDKDLSSQPHLEKRIETTRARREEKCLPHCNREHLHILRDFIDTYGYASVADFYDLIDIGSVYSDNKIGWVNLGDKVVKKDKLGNYVLPKPVPID